MILVDLAATTKVAVASTSTGGTQDGGGILTVTASTTTMTIVVTALVGLFMLVQLVRTYHQTKILKSSTSSSASSSPCDVPWAPGAVPMLGHALAYKDNPARFLVKACHETGSSIFRLNLAGKHMVVVCGPEAQRQVASMPESVMSARTAVADIGFEYTLGYKNVHEGTDFHKGVVKGIFHDPETADAQVRLWLTSIRRALEMETVATNIIRRRQQKQTFPFDFFHVIRRVTLRATVDVMVGTAFLDGWDDFDFISEFMKFQDKLEDVTAKSVVLPRPVASIAILWPFQRRREALQKTIGERLALINAEVDDDARKDRKGFWLQAVEKDHDTSTISELIVGLLFAAHKNPAIGAAQTYLLLHEKARRAELDECRSDARTLLATPSWKIVSPSSRSSSSTTLRRGCLESLRLTAHSIGGVRTAQQDVTLSVGTKIYNISKGSSVSLSHISTHLDRSIWGTDAAEFNLSPSTSRDDLYRDEYKFTTFSHGVHVCPGQQLALLMLQLIVSVLLVEYDVKLPDPIPKLDFERATLAQRERPVVVKLTKIKE